MNRQILGMLSVAAGVSVFSVQDVIVKLLSGTYPVHQIVGVGDRRGRVDLDHPCVDVLLPVLPGDRHAMVPVLHEVRLAELVELDRR